MPQMYPGRSAHREMTEFPIRVLGTGAASPTKQEGNGVTVAWVSTGLYEIAFTGDNPYQFIGWSYAFMSTTPGDVKGFTVVAGDYNATTKKVRVSVYNASVALADLATGVRLCMNFKFARTGAA